jgi:hypothetical protein
LFTTRDESIAAENAAKPVDPGFLTPAHARTMLARWSGIPEAALPVEADDLIEECGGLILAIATIGAMLRGKPLSRWRHVADLVRNSPLDKIQRVLQISVDALDPKTRERYYALAVLLEDMPAHPRIQQVLWGTGPSGAIETVDELIRLSLAQRMADGESIQLHDLLLDLVRSHYADPEALKLIHGAMRLSSHVIDRDPEQFASQLVGRLLPFCGTSAIGDFTQSLIRGAPRPWLRPLKPALQLPGTGLFRTLAGHTDGVSAVAVTPDGRRAVSASGDRTLKVWDLQSGREITTFTCDSSLDCVVESHSTVVAGDQSGRVHFLALQM